MWMTLPFNFISPLKLRVVLQSGYIFAEDLNVINKKTDMEMFINGIVPSDRPAVALPTGTKKPFYIL